MRWLNRSGTGKPRVRPPKLCSDTSFCTVSLDWFYIATFCLGHRVLASRGIARLFKIRGQKGGGVGDWGLMGLKIAALQRLLYSVISCGGSSQGLNFWLRGLKPPPAPLAMSLLASFLSIWITNQCVYVSYALETTDQKLDNCLGVNHHFPNILIHTKT